MNKQIIKKKWGFEEIYVNDDYCMKVMYVFPGTQSSIHRHNKKDETFFIAEGPLVLEHGSRPDKLLMENLQRGQVRRLNPGRWHRFSNYGNRTAIFVEASSHDWSDDTERATSSGHIPDNE